jgi:predicted methyltransferase
MMIRLTQVAHAAVWAVLQYGEIAIDATAGDGHDTRFLSDCVGPTGRVIAFDIQDEALAQTAVTVANATNVTLLPFNHAVMFEAIPVEHHGRIGAIMFNLGYLPGGDKTVITQMESTVRAVDASLSILRPGGVLTVLAYTGHPHGMEETEAVSKILAKHSATEFQVREYRAETDSPTSPRLFVVHKAFANG